MKPQLNSAGECHFLAPLSVFLVGFLTPPLFAAQLAYDAADHPLYSNGVQAGENGGLGFLPWQLSLTNADQNMNGHFVWTSTANADAIDDGSFGGLPNDGDIDTGGRAWGLYANTGQESRMNRYFLNDLSFDTTFSIDFDQGFVDRTGRVGLSLLNALGEERFAFYYRGNSRSHETAGAITSTFPLGFADEGVRLFFTPIGGSESLRVDAVRRDGIHVSMHVDLGGTPGSGIRGVSLFNSNAGPNGPRDTYFNSLRIELIPEPATHLLLALSLVAAGNIRLVRSPRTLPTASCRRLRFS